MRLTFPLKDGDGFALPAGLFIQRVRVDTLQTNYENLQLLLLLVAPNKHIRYSARLNTNNNYSAELNFQVPPGQDYQLAIMSHHETPGFLGHLILFTADE